MTEVNVVNLNTGQNVLESVGQTHAWLGKKGHIVGSNR